MVRNIQFTDIPDELCCQILRHLDPISLLKLMPLNQKIKGCCQTVLETFDLHAAQKAILMRQSLLNHDPKHRSKWTQAVKRHLFPKKNETLGKKMSASFESYHFPVLDLSAVQEQHGVLEIPERVFNQQNLSFGSGKDNFGRKFLSLHVIDTTDKNKTHVITLLQRYTKRDQIHYWMVSQNPSLIHNRKFEPELRSEDIGAITSIMAGCHPQFQLIPQRTKHEILCKPHVR